jgi:hypothetical protein
MSTITIISPTIASLWNAPLKPQYRDTVVYDGWFKNEDEWRKFTRSLPVSPPPAPIVVKPPSPVITVEVEDFRPVRTKMCKFAEKCTRSVCTFAHTLDEWSPPVCRFQSKCNLSCHRYHRKYETKAQYLERLAAPTALEENETPEIPHLFDAIKDLVPLFTPAPPTHKKKPSMASIVKEQGPPAPLNVETQQPSAAPSLRKRTIVCKRFSNCTFEGCTFAHTMEELTPSVCGYQDQCRNKDKCNYIHSGETKEQYVSRLGLFSKVASPPTPVVTVPETTTTKVDQPKRTKMCKRAGHCTYSGCTFAHSLEELSPMVCSFQSKCKHKHKCQYFHDQMETKQQYINRLK